MKRRYLTIFLVLVLLETARVGMTMAGESSDPVILSGLKDQTGVAVTIYNVNLGLVKDQREITLPEGNRELLFMDVASGIIPSSVRIKSLTDPDSLRVLEQNYEYDLLNPQKLLDKYVGKEVRLYEKNPYTEREETVAATLLSNNGGPIFRIGDEISFGHPGRVMFPRVPENLISKPTLVWLIKNTLTSAQKIEASYLTDGISWRADYVLTLNARDDRADISCWVSIDNKSGGTYKDARIKLVAGDVHRVKENEYKGTPIAKQARTLAAAEPQFKEEEFFEYHLYTLQRPSTIKDNQIKQISLVTAENIMLTKELILRGDRYYYYRQYDDPMTNQKIAVFIEMHNKKENSLGIPLPKGIVRVYKKDIEESLQFVGEDSIDHTPKDEKIKIKIGDAFDLVATRKQMNWKKIASDTYEASFEVTVRNHKEEDVVVKVFEPIPGDWTMLSSSHEYKKTEAFTAEFLVMVPKNQETKLAYTVRMRY